MNDQLSKLKSLFSSFKQATGVGLLIAMVLFLPTQFFLASQLALTEAETVAKASARMVSIALEATDSAVSLKRLLASIAANRSIKSIYLMNQSDFKVVHSTEVGPVQESELQEVRKVLYSKKNDQQSQLQESVFKDVTGTLVTVAPVLIEKFHEDHLPSGSYYLVVKGEVSIFNTLFVQQIGLYFLVIFISIAGLLVTQYFKLRKNFFEPFALVVKAIKSWSIEKGQSLQSVSGEGEIVFLKESFLQLMGEKERQDQALTLERSKAIQNAKLASLGEMSAGIAHEINNPLAILNFNLAIMEKYLNQPEKLLPKLQSSQKAMDRIAKIVSGLRKFSRTTNGNEKKALNLSLIVTEAITLIEVKARKFSFSISCDVDPQVMIMGDAIEVEQVLINLINNAIDANKFAEEKWINIKGFTTPQHVVLQVIDSGKGISAKVQEKLFQPFFTTKPIGEGTGLGLSIARGILEDHQASIELTSALGAHTCFEIKFPLIENFKVNSHSTAT